MNDGFPLLTLKKTYSKGIIHELLWFIDAVSEIYKEFGNANIKYLVDNNVHIWDEWAYAKYKKHIEATVNGEKMLVANFENDGIDLKVYDVIKSQEDFIKKIKYDNFFAKKWGELGPVYGQQWTRWKKTTNDELPPNFINEVTHINQIKVAIDTLKNRPDDRGIMVSAWNVADLPDMALRPCHSMFQFITEPLTLDERIKYGIENMNESMPDQHLDWTSKLMNECGIRRFRLSLQLYQRSADTFLGVPFNIASYALLLHMVAQVVNMVPYKFVHTFGDLHLYLNHKNQVNEFLYRTYENPQFEQPDFWKELTKSELNFTAGNYYGPELPKLKINKKIENIFDFRIGDIEIINYNPLPAIKAPVSV
jgi:thymidylate synthase